MANPSLSRPVRNLIIVLAAVGSLLLVVFVLFAWFVCRPFPRVRGKLELPGIARPVEIFRDDNGIPHIWAENPEDLYFAQGWVHAQDRAWQMEFQRRIAAGRLSEILGEGLVKSDRYLRTMGYYEVARQEYNAMENPWRSWLESYSDGVNAYFESRSPGRLGLEFAILRLTGVKWDLDPWTPVDSLAWGKIVTQGLSRNMTDDLRRLNLGRFLGRSGMSDWYAPYRPDMPVAVTEEEFARFRQGQGLPMMPGTGEVPASGGGGEGAGTNVWVLAPERTKGAGAMLMSDMHLGVQMPSIWHEIGLHVVPEKGGEEHHIRGYMFPGIPGVVSGQNQYIAWAQSNLQGDVQDLVAERIHPDDPYLYLVEDEWVPMEVRTEIIRVEGEDEPVVHEVRMTRHGPLITTLENYSGMAGYTWEEGELYHTELALNWPALRPGTQVEAILRLDRATNYDEFREALSYWDSPSINYVYADRDGNIGYQAAGHHPHRPVEQGRLPSPGWTAGEGRLIPFDDLPASYNPEKGYAVSCNNALVYPGYPEYIAYEFSNGFRARRISELIEAQQEGMTEEDIRGVFMDTWSLQADETLFYFETIDSRSALEAREERRESWNRDDDPEEALSRRERRKEEKDFEETLELITAVRDVLDEWDRCVDTDSAGAAAFGFIWVHLITETFSDQLPDYLWPAGTSNLENNLHYLLEDPDNPWWDDRRTTGQVETRDDILARALIGGVLEAADELGDRPQRWEWGEVHQVEFRNASLGESGIGPIEAIFNRGPFPMRGGNSQVHKSNWSIGNHFDITTIPSQRSIYHLADPGRSLFMNTNGQSGHPFHRHYDDMIKPYLDGDFHPSRFHRADVEDAAGGRVLRLVPGEE